MNPELVVPEPAPEPAPLSDAERVRRVVQVALYCIHNIACYRAGWKTGADGTRHQFVDGEFWRRANANFLDVAILEWCKLFAEAKRGRHYISTVVPDLAKFFEAMFTATGVGEKEFEESVEEAKVYRDKFVAHLDDHRVMQIPALDRLLISAIFLHDFLCTEESTRAHLVGHYPNAQLCFDEGLDVASKAYEAGAEKNRS